jgi:hypothetical protein
MAAQPDRRTADPQMDPASLYVEEVFTDRKVGTIRRLAPVKSDGTPDPARQASYAGEAQIMTAAGPLPISFEIEADSLAEAVARFGDCAKEAIENTVRELQEMRRQAASSIVIPQGGLPPGGLPGGGKIQMP